MSERSHTAGGRARGSVRREAAGVTHRAVVGVDGVVGLPVFRVLELAVDETLIRHLHRHVVHVFAHLDKKGTFRVFFVVVGK